LFGLGALLAYLAGQERKRSRAVEAVAEGPAGA
jgi:hypothetical protein